jgi:hypothetical protein
MTYKDWAILDVAISAAVNSAYDSMLGMPLTSKSWAMFKSRVLHNLKHEFSVARGPR